MQTRLRAADADGIAQAAQLLRQGDIVAIPTETVYGIAASALDGTAVKKIFAAKGRPQDNPLIVHIDTLERAKGVAQALPRAAYQLAEAFWPGPLTMVLPRGEAVSDAVCAGLDTVGVRMPSHPVARALIAESSLPFAAPSANLSGSPSPTTAADVLADMQGRLPLILDGGPCQVGVESTVVSLCGQQPLLLRPGYVTPEQMEQVLGQPVQLAGAILHQLQAGETARSPGMKYKHYAPKAEITIVKGSLAQFTQYAKENSKPGMFCLCFDGEESVLPLPCVSYGAPDSGASQAHGLFRALRALDEKEAKTVLARCPQADGVSLAVYNRLLRAAAFRVVEL